MKSNNSHEQANEKQQLIAVNPISVRAEDVSLLFSMDDVLAIETTWNGSRQSG